MDFKKEDLVVITGCIKKENNEKMTADVFKVCFIGMHELVVAPITGYSRRLFKTSKASCTKIYIKKDLNNDAIQPKIGSLVLVFDSDYRGDLKGPKIGHIQEIHIHPGKDTHCVILSNNETILASMQTILVLEA